MKFLDAYILARTKRKTRRIRTALVVIVSSLLFAILFAAAFVAQGVINGTKQVDDVGFNSRFLTSVEPSYAGIDYEAISEAVRAEMDAELEARDIKLTETVKNSIEYSIEQGRRTMDLVGQRRQEMLRQDRQRIAELGNPSGIYTFKDMPLSGSLAHQTDPAVDPLIEEHKEQQVSADQAEPPKILSLYQVEADMLRTQLAPGQSFERQPGEPYPIAISYAYLELLSDRNLPNLSAADRNQIYRELIAEYSGKELTYCYYNSTAAQQLSSVLNYNQQVAEDDDPDTVPIETPVCDSFDQELLEDAGIISSQDDSNNYAEPLFPAEEEPDPKAGRISFKIVGFVPSAHSSVSTDVIGDMFRGIGEFPASSYLGILPSEVVDNDELIQSLLYSGSMRFSRLYADFNTREEQKQFISQSCAGSQCGEEGALLIAPFGNVAVALERPIRLVSTAFLAEAAVIMIIAGLMIMLTISKVISDSTKEIAVFRSLGARRRDIAQIYYTYGAALAFGALVLALVLALVAAYVANSVFGSSIAEELVQATGAYTREVEVSLLGINPTWLLMIVGALVIAAIIGIGVPVLAAVRRKLINILRDE